MEAITFRASFPPIQSAIKVGQDGMRIQLDVPETEMANAVELLVGQKQSGESLKAIQACNDWLRLGPGRSLPLLLQKYTGSDQELPPTIYLGTLKKWSSDYDWQKRAEAYDAEIEQQKNELTQQRRREALETGLALDYERVIKLKRLGEFLEKQLYEQGEDGTFHNLWMPDVRLSKYEKVEIERFNSALIEQIRGVYDDLAKETSGRKQKLEHSGPEGGPIPFKEIIIEMSANEPVENRE